MPHPTTVATSACSWARCFAATAVAAAGVLGRPLRATLADGEPGEAALRDAARQVRRARKRLPDIEAIDFFGANGREAVGGLLADVAARLADEPVSQGQGGRAVQGTQIGELRGKVWVTRCNVHVDRIASAWLVRRFIDPDAAFELLAGKRYAPDDGEVRFDMCEAEYTHDEDRIERGTSLLDDLYRSFQGSR